MINAVVCAILIRNLQQLHEQTTTMTMTSTNVLLRAVIKLKPPTRKQWGDEMTIRLRENMI
jgi:hypothetical protein